MEGRQRGRGSPLQAGKPNELLLALQHHLNAAKFGIHFATEGPCCFLAHLSFKQL